METRNKLFITIFILFLFNLAIAGGKDDLVLEVADNNSFVLQLSDVKHPSIQITLNDADGVTLHDETLLQTSINHRKYDLEELPSGSYVLLVEYDQVIKIQPIQKDHKILKLDSADLKTIFRPSFRQTPGFLDLTMLCLVESKLHLEITDKDGNVLYNERIKPDQVLKKRFNLQALEEGLYTFTLLIKDSVIQKSFEQLITISPVEVTL